MSGAGGWTAKVEGLKELRKAFTQAGKDMQEFKAINAQVAGYAGARAASYAPRSSGMLAASWRPSGTKAQAAVKFGGASVPYAGVIHYGTPPGYRAGARGPHNISASLWATEAIHDTEPTWGEWYVEFIQKVLERNGLA